MENKPQDKREGRELRFARTEKREAGEIGAQSKLIRWLDNYWYHYKWPTIFVAIALVCVIVIVGQLTERKKYDYRFLYAGPISISEKQTAEMSKVLASLAATSEKKSVAAAMNAYFLKTQGQMTQDDLYYAQMLQSNREALQQQMLSGEILIFFMDSALFLEHEASGAGFLPVRDYYPDIPASALTEGSERGLRLDATVLWEHECFRVLAPDTVVCLRTPVSMTSLLDHEKALAYHDRYEALFSRLYQAP